MNDTPSQSINCRAGYYLVAFIDLLGQQDNFKQFKKLPNKNDAAGIEDIKNKLLKIYTPVYELRRFFSDCFRAFSKSYVDRNKINSGLMHNDIKFQAFSDCVVIYLSLRDENNKLPLLGVYSVIASAAVTFISCLAKSHFLRGAIDIGLGIEIDEKEIYGSVLSSAYNLESKTANYPRIIIGDGLQKYLKTFSTEISDNVFIKINKALTDKVMGLLAIDDDGIPFIDYLGEFFKNNLENYAIWSLIPNCYNEIVKASDKFKELKNTRIALRYTLLRNYFEARKSNWNIS